MRLATFNLDNLDVPPHALLPLEVRAKILRPALERLDADILCLQEVNGQHVAGRPERALVALDMLLEGTRYATFHRAATTAMSGIGAADVHNLVTLSRLPIERRSEIRHTLVPPVAARRVTAEPPEDEAEPVLFDRPLLVTEHAGGPEPVTVINVHLRAPLASVIPGQKQGAFLWKSVAGWAEGYYLSAVKRCGQAFELRLLLDQLLNGAPGRLVAIAGDFNAEEHDTPVQIVIGSQEDTGNGALGYQSLVVLDRAIEPGRRWSVLHHGRPQMLDHILASHALFGHFHAIEVHNEAIADEAVGYGKRATHAGSYHAAVVAEFAL